ncbi:glycosyltransferase family 39 protein [bacterium]|nr:glycosyltransferase family 39 protein [bacterium]
MTLIDRFLSSKYSIAFVLIFYFLTCYSVFLIFDIDPQTADYWIWSRHIDWGYLEHPPLLAVSMRFISFFFSDVLVGLKFGSILFSSLIILFAYIAAYLFFDRKAAIIFVLILVTLPYFSIGSIIWSPDKLFLLNWIISWIFIAKFIKDKNINWILLFCGFVGLGLLSKYAMVQMILVVTIWCAANPEVRRSLLKWQSGVGVLIILIIVFPNIYWNYQNEWISFKFNLNQYFPVSSINRQFPYFFLLQFIVYSIAFTLYFWWQLASRHLTRDEIADNSDSSTLIWSFLILSGFIPLVFSIAANLFGHKINLDLLNVSYLSFFLLLARFISLEINHGLISRQIAVFSFSVASTISLIFVAGLLLQSLYTPIILSESISLNHYRGWEETADQIEEICEQNNVSAPEFVITNEHKLSSVLGLYMHNHPKPHSLINEIRNKWSLVSDVKEGKSILVCELKECGEILQVASDRFDAPFKYLGEAQTRFSGKVLRKLKVFVLTPGYI